MEIHQSNITEITFNFSECKFVSPFVVGGIIAIASHLKAQDKTVHLITSKNALISSYFNSIHFPDGYDFEGMSSEEMNNKLEIYNLKTYIPLTLFPTSAKSNESSLRENILSAINSILKKQLKLTGNVLEAIYYLVDELTNNISDHSLSEKGILFGQFYPTKNYMDICIIDYGRGIKQTYLDTEKALPKTHDEAMEFAINGRSTKDQAVSRGFGISTSRRMLTEGLRGKFFLCSGNAMFYQNFEKQEIIALPEQAHFQGCMICLRIPTLPNTQFDFYKYTQ